MSATETEKLANRLAKVVADHEALEVIGEEQPPFVFDWVLKSGRRGGNKVVDGGTVYGVWQKKIVRAHLKKRLKRRYDFTKIEIVEREFEDEESVGDTSSEGLFESYFS